MDLAFRSSLARLRRLTRGRRFLLARRLAAFGLLTLAALSALSSSPPASPEPAVARAGPQLTLPGGPDFATIALRLADASIATFLSRGMHVDVVSVDSTTQSPRILASKATVVDVRSPPEGATRFSGGAAQGPLVFVSLPADTAAQVAGSSLRNPVAVTLR